MAQQKEGDYRNNKYTFGYLNTAQDSYDIEDNGLAELKGVDIDSLALGTIRGSNYKTAGAGPPDWTTCKIVGDEFRLLSGDVQYKNPSAVWANIDSYLPAPPSPSLAYTEEQGLISLELSDPSWNWYTEDQVVTDVAVNTVITPKGHDPLGSDPAVYIDATAYNQANLLRKYKIRINPGVETFSVDYDDAGTYANTYPLITWVSIGNNVYVYAQDYSGHGGNSEVAVFTAVQDLLEDGDYQYTLSEVIDYNGTDVETLYCDVVTAKLQNENYLGQLVKYARPELTIARHATNNRWLYRKGPQDEDWFRIAIIESIADAGTSDPAVFLDNTQVAALIDTTLVSNLNWATMDELLASAGSTSWSHIFEKDNRVWAVPAQKQDVVFFSEPLEWWRWKKTSSIGFNGDFRGIAHVRDDQSVSLENTACIVTSEGLYNIQGNGTEENNYVRVVHESAFGTVTDTLVKANNLLYMVSDGASYEDGEWGRKLYSFDLMQLKELCAIVKNSDPFIDDAKGIVYINQIGGNKIKILMDDNTYIIYHILGEGWGESSDAYEDAGIWKVVTRTEVAMNSYVGKLHNADRLRIRWKGDISFTWTIDGVAGQPIQVSSINESIEEFGVPGNFGKSYYLTIEGSSGSILYDMYMVKES